MGVFLWLEELNYPLPLAFCQKRRQGWTAFQRMPDKPRHRIGQPHQGITFFI
jgi:hypothetical protein